MKKLELGNNYFRILKSIDDEVKAKPVKVEPIKVEPVKKEEPFKKEENDFDFEKLTKDELIYDINVFLANQEMQNVVCLSRESGYAVSRKSILMLQMIVAEILFYRFCHTAKRNEQNNHFNSLVILW